MLVEIGAAIANGGGLWPDDTVTAAANELAPTLEAASKARIKAALEDLLMGRDVDSALEWLMQSGLLAALFPELVDTVNLVQEPGAAAQRRLGSHQAGGQADGATPARALGCAAA